MNKEFVDGLRLFQPRDGAPSFVKGALLINAVELVSWLQAKGEDEIRIDLLEAKSGNWYCAVNDYKKQEKSSPPADDSVYIPGE